MTMEESDMLDGNVAAGILGEVFRADVTTAIVTCAGCGTAGPLAIGDAYVTEMGLVIRCHHCSAVVLRCAQIRERLNMDMRGAASIALG
jgi:uncharacterized protein DUF6510